MRSVQPLQNSPSKSAARQQPTPSNRLCCGLLVALLLLLLVQPLDALKLRFSGLGGEECVRQEIARKSSYVTGSFVSLPGAGLPGLLGGRASYDLQVRNPQGRVIHSVKDQTEAKFSFKARYVGHYQFCLALSEHLGTALLKHGPRDVLWEMHVGHSMAHVKGANLHTEPLWHVLDAVERDLADMKSLQLYFHHREIRNRATMLSTSERIVSWAVLRCLTLLAVALFQINFIRRLFDRPKRSVHV